LPICAEALFDDEQLFVKFSIRPKLAGGSGLTPIDFGENFLN
jgi:hypothetical protein